MNYRSIAQMNQTIRSNLSIIPEDVDIIIGIPRSGMLPASIIALLLNKPLITINDLTSSDIASFSTRNIKLMSEYKKALVIDDSCNTGNSIIKAKKFANEHISGSIEVIYGCIYATSTSTAYVDLYFEVCDQPRAFEWNIMNNWIVPLCCMDLDGVLCVDPTPEQNDDGPKYIDFILNAKPLFIPRYEIGAIVTSRLEKYRKETEAWLKKHNVKYKNLLMLDVPDKETRMRLGLHGVFKADVYRNCGASLFVESDDSQARYIYQKTNKPVYCTGSNCFYDHDESMEMYFRIKDAAGRVEKEAYEALSLMYSFHDKAGEIISSYGVEGSCTVFEGYLNNLAKIFENVYEFTGTKGGLKEFIENYISDSRSVMEKDICELPAFFADTDLIQLELLIDTAIHNVVLSAARKVSLLAWNDEYRKVSSELTQLIINSDTAIEGFEEECEYLKKKEKLVLYPYPFFDRYDESKVEVWQDADRNLKYVEHSGNRLYFPPRDDSMIKHEYNQLIMEQDVESPHHYFSEECNFEEGDIFVDVGAAEGIISLDVLKKAKEIYLLECSDEWVKALEATFEGYSDKVHIIKKYAGRVCDDNTITLDELLKDYVNENIFIKIDAEGMELDILKSGQNVLLNNNCKLSCATYHTNGQADDLAMLFDNLSYSHRFSDRYMLFFFGKMVLDNGYYEHIKAPYFRHVLIRAWREI